MSVKAGIHSAAVIGACLCLEDELVTQIIANPSLPNRQKKIYQMILEWGRTSSVCPTWSSLCVCLASLENEKLMVGVKAYLEDKVSCSETLKGKYTIHMVSLVTIKALKSNMYLQLHEQRSIEIGICLDPT